MKLYFFVFLQVLLFGFSPALMALEEGTLHRQWRDGPENRNVPFIPPASRGSEPSRAKANKGVEVALDDPSIDPITPPKDNPTLDGSKPSNLQDSFLLNLVQQFFKDFNGESTVTRNQAFERAQSEKAITFPDMMACHEMTLDCYIISTTLKVVRNDATVLRKANSEGTFQLTDVQVTPCECRPNTLLDISHVNIKGGEFTIPGTVSFEGILRILRPLTSPIQMQIQLNGSQWPTKIQVPCDVSPDGVQTCYVPDVCPIIDMQDVCASPDSTLRCSPSMCSCSCPIHQGEIDLNSASLTLGPNYLDVLKEVQRREHHAGRVTVNSNGGDACFDFSFYIQSRTRTSI